MFIRALLLCVLGLLLSGSAFAASITYHVTGTLHYDAVSSRGPDTPGLDGSTFDLALTFDPDDQEPALTNAAPDFFYTEYTPALATLTLSGTAGGLNDGVHPTFATFAIRNLHTNQTNDFIEIGFGADLGLNRFTLQEGIVAIVFTDQNTPPTTPAPLLRYDETNVDVVVRSVRWDLRCCPGFFDARRPNDHVKILLSTR